MSRTAVGNESLDRAATESDDVPDPPRGQLTAFGCSVNRIDGDAEKIGSLLDRDAIRAIGGFDGWHGLIGEGERAGVTDTLGNRDEDPILNFDDFSISQYSEFRMPRASLKTLDRRQRLAFVDRLNRAIGGRTLAEIERITGVPQNTVSTWRNPAGSLPRFEQLCAFSEGLGVSLDLLMRGVDASARATAELPLEEHLGAALLREIRANSPDGSATRRFFDGVSATQLGVHAVQHLRARVAREIPKLLEHEATALVVGESLFVFLEAMNVKKPSSDLIARLFEAWTRTCEQLPPLSERIPDTDLVGPFQQAVINPPADSAADSARPLKKRASTKGKRPRAR